MAVSADDIVDASENILSKQHQPEKLLKVRSDLNLLYQHYRDVESGDIYTMCYDARLHKTSVYFNDTRLMDVVSTEFAEIYFGIWLGKRNTIDEDLKRKLLSGGN